MIAKHEERRPAKRKASRGEVGCCDGQRAGRHTVRVRSGLLVAREPQQSESAPRTPTRQVTTCRLKTEAAATASVKQATAASAQHRKKMKRMFENVTSGFCLADKDLEYVGDCAASEGKELADATEGE